ncbi:MAG: hypothetical protein M1813_001262 [Trichoglossum hirsutum]|nr:MAG: hypothetical protein M1813_001262 [Trichoglossum hirsutum]
MAEKPDEISKMYQYYKSARKCHILISMDNPWKPQEIVENLQFVNHILTHMSASSLASEARLTESMTNKLSEWADKPWMFDLDKPTVKSAALNPGLLNCYSTCTLYVRSLFDKLYFSRVWTFEEMLLGKNITMWGINKQSISCIGALGDWINLATDSNDKALKLRNWITEPRFLIPELLGVILAIIEEDILSLAALQKQVNGINSARTDIINGGPYWWYDNHMGICNVFSAISRRPRSCYNKADIFKGLLGVFNGLFTVEEIKREMSGDDMGKISFAFFKQLSIKTGRAWTKLAISHGERKEWDWIPVIANYDKLMTTDCFAGVVNLGQLSRKQDGLAKTTAMIGIDGVPQKCMKILLRRQESRGFQFAFKGCNCGKKLTTGFLKNELIPTYDGVRDVVADETGKMLVHCAMILGNVMDPGCDLVEYREKLLSKLQPDWHWSDRNAKPVEWFHRCVSGTFWENPGLLRTHNMSMNYRMRDMKECRSRLENDSTESILCEVLVNCGCTIIAPFSWIFEAITAVSGSSLGETTVTQSKDNRIEVRDGLGLVQVGNVGKAYNLVAFGGDVDSHKSYAHTCRTTRPDRSAIPKLPWPRGRALVGEEFRHSFTDGLRDYGYVPTGGSGNLLIYRNHPVGDYKIIGVCIDDYIPNKKSQIVTIK